MGKRYTKADYEAYRREVEKQEAKEAAERKERAAFERAKRQWLRGNGDLAVLECDWKSIYKDIQEQERAALLRDSQQRDEAARKRRRPSRI